MKIRHLILFFIIILIAGCKENPIGTYGYGIPNAKAFDNLIKVYALERKLRSNSVLHTIGAYADLDGTNRNGGSWSYSFGIIKNDVDIVHQWEVWYDGKIDLIYAGQSISRHIDVTELGPFLMINSDKAIQLARQYGAEKYVKKHPNAVVKMIYEWKAKLPVIEMKFYDPDTSWGCEPEWWIRADTGDFLYTDYEYCSENQ